jgi:adenylate kinase family enzyme
MNEPCKILVLGNSGSGKTTLARSLADRYALQHLDLDTVVWNPAVVAEERAAADIQSDLEAYATLHARWVIEGSYGDWVGHLSATATLLVFLHPGVEQCLCNQARRAWEPHKYADPAEQERRRAFLMAWTRTYPDRTDRFGLAFHRQVFDAFAGPKLEERDVPRAMKAIAKRQRGPLLGEST